MLRLLGWGAGGAVIPASDLWSVYSESACSFLLVGRDGWTAGGERVSSELQREPAGMTYPLPLTVGFHLLILRASLHMMRSRMLFSPTWEASGIFSAQRPLNAKFHPEDEEGGKNLAGGAVLCAGCVLGPCVAALGWRDCLHFTEKADAQGA